MKKRRVAKTFLAAGLALGMGTASGMAQAGQDMKNAGNDTKSAAKSVGHATSTTAKKVGHKTKSGAQTAGAKTKSAAKTTGHRTENAGDALAGKPAQH